jgi:hypothetical protein
VQVDIEGAMKIEGRGGARRQGEAEAESRVREEARQPERSVNINIRRGTATSRAGCHLTAYCPYITLRMYRMVW